MGQLKNSDNFIGQNQGMTKIIPSFIVDIGKIGDMIPPEFPRRYEPIWKLYLTLRTNCDKITPVKKSPQKLQRGLTKMNKKTTMRQTDRQTRD